MKNRDFGKLDGPVVLFGGPYSNLQAFEAMIAAIGQRDAVCTGDIVAYCAEPNETAALFAASGYPSIVGNCEAQILDDGEGCGCGFAPGSACDTLSAGWWPFLRRSIDRAALAALSELPDIGSFLHQDRRYGVIHGGVTDISRFLWPSSPGAEFEEEIAAVENAIGPVDGIVAGHSGIAFQRMIGRHHWINTGAIGVPPHDGRSETRYVVLENGEATIHRLTYDHQTARARMESAGLVQGYHETLSSGLWPAEDLLPSELRR